MKIKVRAIRNGIADGHMKERGEIFYIDDAPIKAIQPDGTVRIFSNFASEWMEKVDEAIPVTEPKGFFKRFFGKI